MKPRIHQARAIILALCLTGCSLLPKPSADWNQRSAIDTSNTSWANALAKPVSEHAGMSGVHLLPHGRDALSARLVLADTAERCLDVQYYIWKSDNAGRLLAERLVRAADRGVKVRLLLDDVGGSTSDELLYALDVHTNIEVRLFNPIANRFFWKVSALLDFQRINRRMHNKSFTADKLVTIVGGRNIGNHYFEAGDDRQYADLDIIAAGPAANEVSAMFDLYWYGARTIPIYALSRKHATREQSEADRATLSRKAEEIANSAEFSGLAENTVGAALQRHELDLIWGPTRLIYDLPEKVMLDRRDTKAHLLPQLRDLADGAKRELFVISPYFVPGKSGVKFFASVRERGTRVVVLANSLASNDVTPVHAGYSRYREPLLHQGVELYELKPTTEEDGKAKRDEDAYDGRYGSSPGVGLHAKAFAFDRNSLFVTSFNLDPRSATLNTEMGLLIDIADVTGPFVDSLEKSLTETAYRVEFVPGPGPCKECGSLAWVDRENGQEVRYTREPQTSFWRRLFVRTLSLFPIEQQL